MITLSRASRRYAHAPVRTVAKAARRAPVPLTWNLFQATDRHLTQTTDWDFTQAIGRNLRQAKELTPLIRNRTQYACRPRKLAI